MSTASGVLDVSQPGLLALIWAGVGVAAVFVGLRCLIRIRISNKLSDFGADDFWVLAAFVFLLINGILQTLQAPQFYYIVEATDGLVPAGKPLYEHGNEYVRYEFVVIAFFWTVLWCIKASFLAMYYRLFEGLIAWRRCWWFVAIFTFLAYAGAWIASVMTCHPPSTYFSFGACTKPIDQHGSVISISYSTAVDVITDLMIIALPISLIWNLRVTKAAKAGLVFVFSLGLIIIVVAVIRAVEIDGKSYQDPIWLAVWGIVESSVSVIVGCLPPFKSLIKFERTRSSGANSNPHRYDSRRRSDFQELENHSGAMSYTLTDHLSSNKSGADSGPNTQKTFNNGKFKTGSVLLSEDEGSE